MSWTRIPAMAAVVLTTAFQVLAETHPVPAAAMSPPWLDGRPTMQWVASGPTWRPDPTGVVRFVRFDAGMGPTYGILDGTMVHGLLGDLFAPPIVSGRTHALADVRLLTPIGTDSFRRAVWLGSPATTEASLAPALARLDASALSGPGDVLSFPAAPTRVQPVVGAVVGGPPGSPEVFGLTAGLVAYDSPERPRLALGPCIARGLGLDAVAAEGASGGRVRGLLEERRVACGDVMLLPLAGGGPASATPPGGHTVRVQGVGTLRCDCAVS